MAAVTDVSVLLVFFNRPKTFSQVFSQVRRARPARLFLYQDGPRGEQDLEGIEACRAIASETDWECDVHRCYLDANQGCDPTMYRAVTWALSLTDKLIILEDDCVPALSFFPFCQEMLDRYENDTRVMMIAGYNTDEVTTDVSADYFFTSVFSIWGWATWRRVADQWDSDYTFMHDAYNLRQLEALIRNAATAPTRFPCSVSTAFRARGTSRPSCRRLCCWAAVWPSCPRATSSATSASRRALTTPRRCRPCHAVCAACSPWSAAS